MTTADKIAALPKFPAPQVHVFGDTTITFTDGTNDAAMIEALRARLALAVEALEASNAELKHDLEAFGPCDHDVGACLCTLENLIRGNDAVLAAIKEA